MIQVEISECIEVDYWDGEAFKSMNNLKILILENAKFSQGPKYLPNCLAVLRWIGYPSSSMPCGFHPKHLVEFDVRDSDFKSILETISKIKQNAKNVNVLNFSRCKNIRQIPNLSGIPSLKRLWLSDCENLIEIDNSVGQLAKLEALDVGGCTQLMTFPSEMNTPSLVHLNLCCCWNLNYFPEIVTREMKLPYLSLFGTGMDQLPQSVENLTKLTLLDIGSTEGIESMKLPSSTFWLPKLQHITVEGYYGEVFMEAGPIKCPNIAGLELKKCNISNENLQIYLNSFSNVRSLDLSGSDFTILPSCIEDCQNLARLVLNECKHLIEVEKFPPSILQLMAGDCTSLSLESRKLLLSKELLASVVPINDEIELYGEAYFYVPGGSIPKWFDHCIKGPSISFWLRGQYCPTLCVCAILEPMGILDTVKIEAVTKNYKREYTCFVNTGCGEDHIIVHYLWDFKTHVLFGKDQWTHATICFSSKYKDAAVKESGIYAIRDEWTNMKNIRFTNPFQSSDFSRAHQVNVIRMHANSEKINRNHHARA